MKKVFRIVLFFLIIIPAFVCAKSYDAGVKNASELLINKYSKYDEYLLIGKQPYVYKNGSNIIDDRFINGGFLNVEEYIISLPNDKTTSYLSIGDEFFVTKYSESDKYVIAGASANDEYKGKKIKGLKNNVTDAEVRVTEFVRPSTKVIGYGTISNPWQFVTSFNLSFEFKDTEVAYMGKLAHDPVINAELLSALYTKGDVNSCKNHNCTVNAGSYLPKCDNTSECVAKIKIEPTEVYEYSYNTCGGSYNKETHYLEVKNLIKDTKCKIGFKKIKDSYDVEYYGNGADNGNVMQSESFFMNQKYKLSKNKFVKQDYVFQGWSRNPDGTGTKYSDEQEVTNLASIPDTIVQLYAIWGKNGPTCIGKEKGNESAFFNYTGSYDYACENGDWEIGLKTSGFLTFNEDVDVELFLLGGGANGTYTHGFQDSYDWNVYFQTNGSGGNGGKALTIRRGISLASKAHYKAVIGKAEGDSTFTYGASIKNSKDGKKTGIGGKGSSSSTLMQGHSSALGYYTYSIPLSSTEGGSPSNGVLAFGNHEPLLYKGVLFGGGGAAADSSSVAGQTSGGAKKKNGKTNQGGGGGADGGKGGSGLIIVRNQRLLTDDAYAGYEQLILDGNGGNLIFNKEYVSSKKLYAYYGRSQLVTPIYDTNNPTIITDEKQVIARQGTITDSPGQNVLFLYAERTGYQLKGWYTSPTNSKIVLENNGNFKPGTDFANNQRSWKYTKDLKLYAQWTPVLQTLYVNKDGVAYANDKNGNKTSELLKEGVYPNNPCYISDKNECYTGTTLQYIAQKEGYQFDGWYTSNKDNNGSGTLVINNFGELQPNVTINKKTKIDSEGHWVSTDTADTKLYAKFSPIGKSITLDANYGVVGADNSSSVIINIKNDATTITKTVPTFKNVSISYEIPEELAQAGLALPKSPKPVTSLTYTFDGWYTKPEGGYKVVDKDGKTLVANAKDENDDAITDGNKKFVYDGDLTLYAQWSITKVLPTISNTNYTCSWLQNGEVGDSYNYGEVFKYTIVSGDKFVLSCKENKWYKISLDLNGGTSTNYPTEVQAQYNVTTNFKSSLPANTSSKPNPVRSNVIKYDVSQTEHESAIQSVKKSQTITFTFLGWFTEKDNGIQLVKPDRTLIKNVDGYTDASGRWIKEEDVTLYAQWSTKTKVPNFPNNHYTCYFVKNDMNSANIINIGSVFGTDIANNDVFYYICNRNQSYQITLDKNDATNEPTASVNVVYNESKTVKGKVAPVRKYTSFKSHFQNPDDVTGYTIKNVPTEVKFTFAGWTTEKNDGVKVVNAGGSLVKNIEGYTSNAKEPVWIGKEDMTLYASWTPATNMPTITKSGYTCYWIKDGNEDVIIPNGSKIDISINSSTMFKAVCDLNPIYTLTLLKGAATNILEDQQVAVKYNTTKTLDGLKLITNSKVAFKSPTRSIKVNYDTNGFGVLNSSRKKFNNVTGSAASYSFYGFEDSDGNLITDGGNKNSFFANIVGYTNANKQWIRKEDTTLTPYFNSKTVVPYIELADHDCYWSDTEDGTGILLTPGVDYILPEIENGTTFYAYCKEIY